MVLGGFVGGFGWFWMVLGGFGSFWLVPCFSNYVLIYPRKFTLEKACLTFMAVGEYVRGKTLKV